MSVHPPATIDRVARAIAVEFGYESVFMPTSREDTYDVSYWQRLAVNVLAAVEPPALPERREEA